ncbi:hypothetical protein QN277_024149 [Acacia crassicarpa]|uniref:Uncharacterized protein n=1 Tax=Acacia crassicarpa TaxID=499986 RepID=A0AAE1JEM5_9FABA|nr:hypothetical protein QN277_024149 [Acacia crassicarpa]
MASDSLKLSLVTLFIFAVVLSQTTTLTCEAARARPPRAPAPKPLRHSRIPNNPICPQCVCCAPPPAPGKCCSCLC